MAGGTTPAALARRIAQYGDVRKYIGHPCKWGHTGTRYMRNGGCVECHYFLRKRQLIRERNAKKGQDASAQGATDTGRTEQSIRRTPPR